MASSFATLLHESFVTFATDKKRMNKVKGKLVLQQMVNVPGITVINGNMDIQVDYENKNGGNSIYCYSICTDDEMQQLLKE